METIKTSLEWWLIFMLSIIPYTPLFVGAVKNNKDRSHNTLVWGLYLALDIITLFTGTKERINADPMVFGFAIGSLIMASILCYQKRFAHFGIVEITATILTLFGITLWMLVGPYTAFLFSIFSEVIIGGYLIYKTFKSPTLDYNFVSYTGFLLVSSFSVITTDKWTISEVGYAISETILNIIILIPLFPLFIKKRIPFLNTIIRKRRYEKRRRKSIRPGFV